MNSLSSRNKEFNHFKHEISIYDHGGYMILFEIPMKVSIIIRLCLPVVSANAPHKGDTKNVTAGVIAPRIPTKLSMI